MSIRERLSGNEAAATAMKQINPDVVAAFPITPSTEIPQYFSTFVDNGMVDTEFVAVESEHSAMSACIGAEAAGARAMTATSANGLSLMWEMIYIASSLRLPIVMSLVNRAVSGPLNIHNDHSDAMGVRDSGWIQLFSETNQEGIGKAILNGTCQNVHVLNELDVPVLCMGLHDVVVSASPEGILVSDKEQSSYIKPYVDAIDQQVMFAEKSWGSFRVLDVEDESMTIKVTLNPGHSMNYHSHSRRDEVWNVISGRGRAIVDGMEQPVQAGDVITMQAGCRHTIIADTELKVIEVQLGKEISVHVKQKFPLED